MSCNHLTPSEETWKPVLGYDATHEVSSLGRVRSLPRIILTPNNPRQSWAARQGKILSPFAGHHGYLRVQISREGRSKARLIHVLVCEAFHGPRPEGMQAAHRNGISNDNRPDNLRWATYAENQADKVLHGSIVRGDRHPNGKLSPEAVREVRNLFSRGHSCREIAERFGVTKTTVRSVKTGANWAWVT